MNNWLLSHWYLLVGALVIVVGAACVGYASSHPRKEGSPSLLAFLLVWPTIFEQEAAAKKKSRLAFVVFGVLIGLLLIVVGMTVNSRR